MPEASPRRSCPPRCHPVARDSAAARTSGSAGKPPEICRAAPVARGRPRVPRVVTSASQIEAESWPRSDHGRAWSTGRGRPGARPDRQNWVSFSPGGRHRRCSSGTMAAWTEVEPRWTWLDEETEVRGRGAWEGPRAPSADRLWSRWQRVGRRCDRGEQLHLLGIAARARSASAVRVIVIDVQPTKTGAVQGGRRPACLVSERQSGFQSNAEVAL